MIETAQILRNILGFNTLNDDDYSLPHYYAEQEYYLPPDFSKARTAFIFNIHFHLL
jgi:hypothetical protein